MTQWNERPSEIAHLFNPAFCSLLVNEGVQGFREKQGIGMPVALVALVLPIVLHKRTRCALPRSVGTKMHPWLQENQQARIGFAARCAGMMPSFRDAIVFGSSAGIFSILEDRVVAGRRVVLTPWREDSEPEECIEKARFVGRWIGTAGDPATIYTMWGIRP